MSDTEAISVRSLRVDEAELLVGLIERCYGASYIDSSFYEVESVRDRFESGELHSVGAFEATGSLVGHMTIHIRVPGDLTADAGTTLVDPAWRGRGIARRVAGGLARRALELGLIGVHDYPVTVHSATQRIGADFGVHTGLMLANLPEDVVFEAMNAGVAGGRTSSVIRWLPFREAPRRRVWLPARYAERLQATFQACYLVRDVAEQAASAATGRTKLGVTFDPRRQTARIQALGAGDDLAEALARELRKAALDGAAIAHLDVPLCEPSAPRVTEAARSAGFFFAGLLPEFRDGDVLRLQWLHGSVPVRPAAALRSDVTRELEAFILADRP